MRPGVLSCYSGQDLAVRVCRIALWPEAHADVRAALAGAGDSVAAKAVGDVLAAEGVAAQGAARPSKAWILPVAMGGLGALEASTAATAGDLARETFIDDFSDYEDRPEDAQDSDLEGEFSSKVDWVAIPRGVDSRAESKDEDARVEDNSVDQEVAGASGVAPPISRTADEVGCEEEGIWCEEGRADVGPGSNAPDDHEEAEAAGVTRTYIDDFSDYDVEEGEGGPELKDDLERVDQMDWATIGPGTPSGTRRACELE